ncbi:MAG: GGDEF domain-containing protein [Clostridia bacterium]|nr:GGDEF domain-containing protein [Clostridia bacterium]
MKKILLSIVFPFLILLSVVFAISAIIYQYQKASILESTKIQIENDTSSYEKLIIGQTEQVISDTLFLTSMVKEMFISSFDQPTSEDYNKIDLFNHSIINLCNNRSDYYGVRIIDFNGRELFNLHYYNDGFYSFLNKNISYHEDEDFRKAKFLDYGRVYISDIKSNKTMAVYSTIYNYSGQPIGVLVIEAYSDIILANINELSPYQYEYVDIRGNVVKSELLDEDLANLNMKDVNPKLYDDIVFYNEGYYTDKDTFAYYEAVNLYGNHIDSYPRTLFLITYLKDDYYKNIYKPLERKFLLNMILGFLIVASITALWASFRIKEQNYKKELKTLAFRDHLTNIYNREFFMTELSHKIIKEKPFSIIFFDVDDFKNINDTYGHDCGDYILVEISKRILGVLRGNDMVARIGGDEFNVCIDNVVDRQITESILKRIMKAFQVPIKYSDNEIFISFSMGISLFPGDALTLNDVLIKADTAMYYIKKHRKNGYKFYADLEQEDRYNEKLHLST